MNPFARAVFSPPFSRREGSGKTTQIAALAARLFGDEALWVPYTDPGLPLARTIVEARRAYTHEAAAFLREVEIEWPESQNIPARQTG